MAKKCMVNTCDAITFVVVCCTLIMSIICTLNTNKTWINKTLWAFSFPVRPRPGEETIPVGKAVSIGWDGNVIVGGGTTIKREAYTTRMNEQMRNLKTTHLNHFMAVAAYDGNIVAVPVRFDGVVDNLLIHPLPFTEEGKLREVSNIVTLTNTTVVVIGSNEILPVFVSWNFTPDHHLNTTFTYGKPYHFITGDYTYPHADVMSESRICVTYENADKNLYTFVADLHQTGIDAYFSYTTHVKYSPMYSYHGIAGFDQDSYLLIATGRLDNGTEVHDHWSIRAAIATVEGNTVTVHDWVQLFGSDTMDYFAVDNFDSHFAVLVYYNIQNGNALTGQLVQYDRVNQIPIFTSSIRLSRSLSSTHLERVSMKMLSPIRFAVFFDNIASSNSQGLSLIQAELTPSGGLVAIDNVFPIIESRRQPMTYAHYGVCSLNREMFVLIENYGDNRMGYLQASVGYMKMRAIGITSETVFGSATIQFGGLYIARSGKPFRPGYTYYTDNDGNLVRGRPFGWNNMDFGNFYVNDREGKQILSTVNMIGYAVSETELMINYY